MKFLAITLLLCLAAEALADVDKGEANGHDKKKDHDDNGEHKGHGGDGDNGEHKGHGGGGDDGGDDGDLFDGGLFGFPAPTPDLSTVVHEETETKRYKLTWMEKLQQALAEGQRQGTFPPIEGSLNSILTGTLETSRGSLKGLEPAVQSVYVTPLPTVRIILAASKIKVCGPQTHLEFLLNHIICFVNGPLYLAQAVSPLPICIKGREVQCYGPFMRLPDTLTPGQIATALGGSSATDLVNDVNLVEVDETGNPISTTDVDTSSSTETTTTEEEGGSTTEEQVGEETPGPDSSVDTGLIDV